VRYVLRAPLAQERIALQEDGLVRLLLKRVLARRGWSWARLATSTPY
jgi:hypothetical protein